MSAMQTEKVISEIKEAVESLGYNTKGIVIQMQEIGLNRYIVNLAGSYFGIYDMDKQTFVD